MHADHAHPEHAHDGDAETAHLHPDHAHTHEGNVDVAVWATRFTLLSDPHRLEILLVLHQQPGIFVGDLAAAVGRTETAVSQALRVLRQQGWVSSTRVGRSVGYRLEDETVHRLLHWIGAGHIPSDGPA
ncbi:metalloregulator ArsR/SmtB family transcription factor [Gordonia sp. NB41Y]|uniref:ArsR/SmtB family transcription factor n=1 Tax=Gordonia sp. NB41Y TaxID=875808 RepID=UPI000346FCBF|nr:metalloregulator ArsR/SmtB family transcription factor [Gordonia sp. NB41Y]WLP91407.1 metalloregulator ArsR/SmtB family transcription factor [Gordonia sp. NB41Y]